MDIERCRKAKRSQKSWEQFSVQSSEFKVGNNPELETLNPELTEDKAGRLQQKVRILNYLRRKIFLSPLQWSGWGRLP